MISGIDLNQTWEYVLPQDKKAPTTWILGVLPASLVGLLVDRTTPQNNYEIMGWIVRMGLRGWKDFNTKAEYKTVEADCFGRKVEVLSMEVFDALPPMVIPILAREIQSKFNLSVADQKN